MNGKFSDIGRKNFSKTLMLCVFNGLCPALAVTVSLKGAFTFGIVVTVVLAASDFLTAALCRRMTTGIRSAVYLMTAAGLICAAEVFIEAYMPSVSDLLGIYLPVAAVCGLFVRESTMTCVNTGVAAFRGFVCGIAYTTAISVISFLRELLGAGTLFAGADGSGGIRIPESVFSPLRIFVLPCGAFLVFGILAAVLRYIGIRTERSRRGGSAEVKDV